MGTNLQSRKRQLVRDAIYDAAIDLFVKKGFDETTVEEVAEAAGISRRSFFRHFESKDDLLALNTVHCGEILCQTVASCPASLSPLETVRETVLAGLRFTEAQKHTRQIIEISQRSTSARQAHLSRLVEVEDKVAEAFAARIKSVSPYNVRPIVLGGMTQLLINASIGSWFMGEHKDTFTAAKHGLRSLKEIFSDAPVASSDEPARLGNRGLASKATKRSRRAKREGLPGANPANPKHYLKIHDGGHHLHPSDAS